MRRGRIIYFFQHFYLLCTLTRSSTMTRVFLFFLLFIPPHSTETSFDRIKLSSSSESLFYCYIAILYAKKRDSVLCNKHDKFVDKFLSRASDMIWYTEPLRLLITWLSSLLTPSSLVSIWLDMDISRVRDMLGDSKSAICCNFERISLDHVKMSQILGDFSVKSQTQHTYIRVCSMSAIFPPRQL